MGIAITSGVLASLHSQSRLHGLNSGQPKWESHTPGTSTPTIADGDDPTLPSRFIACVQREESARRLRENFVPFLEEMLSKSLSGKMFRRCSSPMLSCCGTHKFIIILFGILANTFLSPSPKKKTIKFSCKPQSACPVLGENGLKEALAGKLLISILTGVTIAQLSAWVLPSTTVVRATPNVACRVRLCL